ncbi:hypothetical protein [Haloferula sp. BvORR071]|uniref:hypothetical protein n=1 Tax=Haloferula sp. BvORR071 TaxID=1396141 RepID=UPI002240F9EE|nr:hypothetical protein [Haloferula sp. BvORR071]
MRSLLGISLAVIMALPAAMGQDAKPDKPGIPEDLLSDEHVREELAVNEFTAPSIAKIFESLEALAPIPMLKSPRDTVTKMPSNRADLAVELGFLIADGFLIVQAGELTKVETMAADLTKYGKGLGVGEKVNRHAASLLESAHKKDVPTLKKELAATQKDVELELVSLRDPDVAHLISLGGWIRALQVSSGAVETQFSEERAKQVMREDIADYYSQVVSGLEPKISERANYVAMRDLLAGLSHEMVTDGNPATKERMVEIHKQAEKLVELALTRHE